MDAGIRTDGKGDLFHGSQEIRGCISLMFDPRRGPPQDFLVLTGKESNRFEINVEVKIFATHLASSNGIIPQAE